MQELALVSVLVPDYDEGIEHFVGDLGFELREDTDLGDGKRWVVVGPPGSDGCGLLLARASKPTQEDRIGDQTGGRVFLFLHTDDFAADHDRLTKAGVRFVEGPRDEVYGTVAVFQDRFGNKWDLIERSD